MNNPKYSVKLKVIYSIMMITIPVIIVAVLFYLSFYREINHLFMLTFILFGSFLGAIKYYNIPMEIQLFEKSLILKSLYGREIILDIDKIKTVEAKSGIIFIKTKNERIICFNGFSRLSVMFDELKKSNPQVVFKGI